MQDHNKMQLSGQGWGQGYVTMGSARSGWGGEGLLLPGSRAWCPCLPVPTPHTAIGWHRLKLQGPACTGQPRWPELMVPLRGPHEDFGRWIPAEELSEGEAERGKHLETNNPEPAALE